MSLLFGPLAGFVSGGGGGPSPITDLGGYIIIVRRRTS
jgi:hypothetical protein